MNWVSNKLMGKSKEDQGLEDMMKRIRSNSEIKLDEEDEREDEGCLDLLNEEDNIFAFSENKNQNKEIQGNQKKGSFLKTAGSLFGKVKKMAGFDKKTGMSFLHENEVDLISKELLLMSQEYPNNPGFVKRMASVFEDNRRLRTVLKSQTILDENKKSNIILLQFLEFFEEVVCMRRSLFDKKNTIRDNLKSKDDEIMRLKLAIQETKQQCSISDTEEIQKRKAQTIRILDSFHGFVEDIRQSVEEMKEELVDLKGEFEADLISLNLEFKTIRSMKKRIAIIFKKLSRKLKDNQTKLKVKITSADVNNSSNIILMEKPKENTQKSSSSVSEGDEEDDIDGLDILGANPWGTDTAIQDSSNNEVEEINESKEINAKEINIDFSGILGEKPVSSSRLGKETTKLKVNLFQRKLKPKK